MRTIIFWGLYLGPLILGDYHIYLISFVMALQYHLKRIVLDQGNSGSLHLPTPQDARLLPTAGGLCWTTL